MMMRNSILVIGFILSCVSLGKTQNHLSGDAGRGTLAPSQTTGARRTAPSPKNADINDPVAGIAAKIPSLVPTRTTRNGTKFTQPTSEDLTALGITDLIKFGEAWEDPTGVIWGDVARGKDGFPKTMSHAAASAYCAGIGARLPTGYVDSQNGKGKNPKTDSDFVRLRKYMGAKRGTEFRKPEAKDYNPEILPNLAVEYRYWGADQPSDTYNGQPWDSEVRSIFNGSNGRIMPYDTERDDFVMVRCVKSRNKPAKDA
ncbi:hypothetical protein K2X33_10765 [bacterium]|nr:hypothetical protein [bacterium]